MNLIFTKIDKATVGNIIRTYAEPLRKVNPNVRDEEIEFFAEQWKTLDLVLEAASPRLDAVRIIITT